ncbi:MAG: ATP-binding protein [Deltaproteobacteria bacterium]|nr:ATP-binding protein [Deltaproteobacteria bacterium]
MGASFERAIVSRIEKRLSRPPNLIQVVVGPRQVGKTTAVRSVAARWSGPVHFAAADLPLPPGPEWIETQWTLARRTAGRQAGLLVLDEVHKVRGWSEQVKALWDQDRAAGRPLRVLILGSSALLLGQGVTESLSGRFFLHRCPHWSYAECRQAFGWDLDQWLFFGGYPGAAPLIDDEEGWRAYVADSLIETVLSRDVLAMQTVAKPALLRHLFGLAASFPAQILSYNKMLGQLQDAGNTTTLAHYLRLLATAYLVSGLERFSAGQVRAKGSSPKLVMWNDALVTAVGLRSFASARQDAAYWGRLVENSVGAHLLNHLQGLAFEVTYWRERNQEVDYVVRSGTRLWAVEVKSGRPARPMGLSAFKRLQPRAIPVVIGSGGLDIEEFFAADPRELFPSLAG